MFDRQTFPSGEGFRTKFNTHPPPPPHTSLSPHAPFSSPEPTFLLACGRNRELWEQPFQACAIDADFVRPDGQNSVTSFVISKWLLPELSIPAAGQKDRWLWGRECTRPLHLQNVFQLKHAQWSCLRYKLSSSRGDKLPRYPTLKEQSHYVESF